MFFYITFIMNKITLLTFLTIFFFLQNQLTQAQCHIDDWTALKAIYESTDGDNWTNRSGWDAVIASHNTPPTNCNLDNLYGVSSFDEDERIDYLSLSNNNLNGYIPPEIELLGHIKKLYLLNNHLTGHIPAEIGSLLRLTELKLNINQLTGNILPEIGNLSSLNLLWLFTNQLEGDIPTELNNLTMLTELKLYGNNLTGTIPLELGSLTSLVELLLNGNSLIGEIPSALCNLSNLTRLTVGDNDMNGCYHNCLSVFCTLLTHSEFSEITSISLGNNFDATWVDFCTTNAGVCDNNLTEMSVATNYSGNINITLDTNQAGDYIIKNNYGKVSDYSICIPGNNTNCPSVVGINNLAANEVLWALQKATEYFSNEHNIVPPPLNTYILRNEQNYINDAAFNNLDEVIYFGAGDNSSFTSMTAPDIVGHEFSHYLTWIDTTLTDLNNTHEPGALKESFADIFGELIEHYAYGSNDWVFGQQVSLNSGGLRSLSNPLDPNMERLCPNYYEGDNWLYFPNYNYIDCLNEDRCGIHTNCGVQNYWFYLLSEGGLGVSGLGIDKAAKIAFNNLKSLKRNASYKDAMYGSILAAKQLYGENVNEVQQTINAWKAVGLDVEKYNSITWQIANETQIGEPFIGADGRERVMMEFDLIIDSLNQDLTADGLEFTLTDKYNSAYKFEHIELKTINPVLQANEVDTIYQTNSNDLTVKINRINNGAAKTKQPLNRMASRTSIGTFIVCIVVIDATGGNSQSLSLDITGITQIQAANQQHIPFQSRSLLFGSSIHNSTENNGTAQYFLVLQLELTHKNCQNMGVLEFEIVDENQLSVAPYMYCLKNDLGAEIDAGNFQYKNFALYNLDEGNYELHIEDSSTDNRQITKNFIVEFRPNVDGSLCCPNELTIPSGYIYGTYQAVNRISINRGTSIDKGTIKICD